MKLELEIEIGRIKISVRLPSSRKIRTPHDVRAESVGVAIGGRKGDVFPSDARVSELQAWLTQDARCPPLRDLGATLSTSR